MQQTNLVPSTRTRLLSLDVMRGLDMCFLVVVGPLLAAWQRAWGLPNWLSHQLQHVNWEGLTAWDLIMPWFIFMCGAAIPFALPKQLENGRARWKFWKHVTFRVGMLWLLGMIVQGNLLSFHLPAIQFYNNTLQAIAAGYLIAALCYLIPKSYWRALLPLLLALGYGIALALGGDYTPQGNLAIRVEQWIFPSNHDGYGWVLTTPMFGVMTLCGMYCTELLQSPKTAFRKVLTLAILGSALLFGGLVLSHWEPAIKRIYTVSFTAQALGWGVLLLTTLYLIIDVCHLTRGWGFFTLYGRWALTAYLCGTLFWRTFLTATQTLCYGTAQWVKPETFGVIQTAVALLLLTALLHLRERAK